ncbi:hypothetical protein A6A29_40555 [Streptomyces sp. TSRI0281]|nr:hypothetical protein A6A29_40555 [Streptomyces sp. TSRI0281]
MDVRRTGPDAARRDRTAIAAQREDRTLAKIEEDMVPAVDDISVILRRPAQDLPVEESCGEHITGLQVQTGGGAAVVRLPGEGGALLIRRRQRLISVR